MNLELILKFFLFVFKSLQNQCPQYLSEWHHPPTQSRSLRSGDSNLLSIPRTRLKNRGDQAFAAIGPKLWNIRLKSDLPKICQFLNLLW